MRVSVSRLACAVVACLAVAACGSSADDASTADDPGGQTGTAVADGFPVEIDNCGRTVTIEEPPERVLTGYQNTVELMIALGLGDRVVARQPFTQSPVLPDQEAQFNAIPELAAGLGAGDSKATSREAQLATEPDFVLASADFELARSRGVASIEDFEQAGADVYVLANADRAGGCADGASPLNLLYTDIVNLGAIFGVSDRAEALVEEMQTDVAAVIQRLEGRDPVPMFAYDSGEGPLTAVSNAYFDFSLVGGANVIDDVSTGYPEVGIESVAAGNPEVIVTVNYADGPLEEEAERKAVFLREALSSTDAAAEGRFVAIESIDTTPGIRNVRAIEALARALHPDAFSSG